MGGGGGPNGSGNGPSHGGGGGAPQPHGGRSLPHGAPWKRPRQSLSPGFHGGRQSWLSGPRKSGPPGLWKSPGGPPGPPGPPGPRKSPCGGPPGPRSSCGPPGPRCGGGPPPGPPGPHCTPGPGVQGGAAFATPDPRPIPVIPRVQPIAAPAIACLKFITWPFARRETPQPEAEVI